MLTLKEEKNIVKKARKNRKDFGPLYDEYFKRVYNFLFFRTHDTHSADELTSQVFEKALNGLDNYQWQGIPFSAWLFRISRNTLIDYYRTSEKQKINTALHENGNYVSKTNNPQEDYESLISEKILHRLLNELPQREKDIIYMKFFDGYTNKIISKVTGLTETNVSTIIYRTLKELRSQYLARPENAIEK